jgi:hypothetical protein
MLLCRADRQPDPDKLSSDTLGTSPIFTVCICTYGYAVRNNQSMHGKVLEMHME